MGFVLTGLRQRNADRMIEKGFEKLTEPLKETAHIFDPDLTDFSSKVKRAQKNKSDLNLEELL